MAKVTPLRWPTKGKQPIPAKHPNVPEKVIVSGTCEEYLAKTKRMMTVKEKTITYYETPGESDTEATFLCTKERAESLGIRDVVVASTTGRTGVRACQIFKGFRLIVVRHHTGFQTPWVTANDA